MKHFLLLTFMVFSVAAVSAQLTFRTIASGNYTDDATWSGGPDDIPPIGTFAAPANCNCNIVVSAGTNLTINVDVFLNNAKIILEGAGSQLTFSGGRDLNLFGVGSAIDIQSTEASISSSNQNSVIRLGTTSPGSIIFQGNTTQFPGSAPLGTVQGLASAAASRGTPQFLAGTLPVKLSEFLVAEKGSSVSLSWKTELEINSSHFDIQRSGDSKDWLTIGTVNAAGNVSVEQSYSFNDVAPANGTNYYRLKIVDIDANFEFSPIKSVSITSNGLVVSSNPNPASSMLNVSINQPGSEPFRLRLINRSGQVVYDQKHPASISRISLNVSAFAEGTYFLEATNSTGLRQINKVMIVHK